MSLKTTRTHFAIPLSYGEALVLTADQLAVVLKAVQGATIYRSEHPPSDRTGGDYRTLFVATEKVLEVRQVLDRDLFDRIEDLDAAYPPLPTEAEE